MKDAAQDVVQGEVEGVLGATENGSVTVLVVVSIVILQRRNPRRAHALYSPRLTLGDT